MQEIQEMKIYLLSVKTNMIEAWDKLFSAEPNVTVSHGYFDDFMRQNRVECVVSPANSYGLMDGGYDRAITDHFGEQLMDRVQQYILRHYRGEQPVGSSFIIDAGMGGMKLIHTPTMRIPCPIKDPMVVYHCMRSCLLTALENDVKSIVIPAFGGGCGMLTPEAVAALMWEGYLQLKIPPQTIDWAYAERIRPEEKNEEKYREKS